MIANSIFKINNNDIRDLVNNSDFYVWLRGFIDFSINNRFKFRFQIKLHCDDRPLLEYIQNRLKIGDVYPFQTSIIKDIEQLIVNFELSSFNT